MSSAATHARESRPGAEGWPCRIGDAISEAGFYAAFAAGPWMFGATSKLAFKVVGAGAALAGLGQFVTWVFRRNAKQQEREAAPMVRLLLWLNILYLAYITLSIVNARATFHELQLSFTYFEAIPWLPATYNRAETIEYLLQLLSVSGLFWSLRAWLLGGGEERRVNPARLRRFLSVLIVNGALIALAGLVQRAMGAKKLLFMYELRWGGSTGFYGPFPYRGNASQFLNMLWPVALGFWRYLAERRPPGKRDGPELLLLPLAGIILGSSLASLSRNGFITATLLLMLIGIYLFSRRTSIKNILFLAPVALTLLAAVAWLAGPATLERFEYTGLKLSMREYVYENSLKILEDYPIYGVGAGAFGAIYHSYRGTYHEAWQAYAHNDWLEALATTGGVGFGLQMAMLAALVAIPLKRRRDLNPLALSALLALIGCCTAVVFDFGFQIYGVLLLFVALAALLVTLGTGPESETGRPLYRVRKRKEEAA